MKEKNLSWLSVEPHLKIFHKLGYFSWYGASGPKKILQQLICIANISFPLMYVIQGIVFIYQKRNNATKITDALFLLLSFADSISKQFSMLINHDIIEELLAAMKGPYFNKDNETHKTILRNRVKESKFYLNLFHVLVHSTCFLWLIFPVVDYLQGKIVEPTIWFPFEYSSSPRIYFVLIYTWTQAEFLGYNNTTIDVFISGFILQCKVQITILRLDLENAVEVAMENAAEQNTSFSRALEEKLDGIFMHYEEIVKFAKNIENAFSVAMFVQFLVTSLILCTSTYKMVNVSPASMEFMSMVLYLSCIIFQLFLYCICGNDLVYESEQLMESVYKLDWLQAPVQVRKSLIIFMERVKRPIQLNAGSIIPVSAKTYINILRSAYSFYAFLTKSSE